MTFKTLDLQTKKWLFWFLLCLFSWWLFSAQATCSASTMPEKTYQITETQLQALEQKLTLLDQVLAQHAAAAADRVEARISDAQERAEYVKGTADEGRRIIAECQSILRAVRSGGKEKAPQN